MRKADIDENVFTFQKTLEDLKQSHDQNKLSIYNSFISSMINYSRTNNYKEEYKVMLDNILTLAIQQQDYKLLSSMINQVPTLKDYMQTKGFIDDNDCYILLAGNNNAQ